MDKEQIKEVNEELVMMEFDPEKDLIDYLIYSKERGDNDED